MEQDVSLSKLADAVNLSEDTLNTYVSCGILRGESREGEVFFSLAEIQTIFGDLAINRISTPASSTTEGATASVPDQSAQATRVDPAPEPPINPEISTPEPAATEVAASATSSPSPLSPELLSLAASLREQIDFLKQERDWLRTRVEHLESRSDRDQMLILSQTENVRKLIANPPKRSWLGLLPWNKQQ